MRHRRSRMCVRRCGGWCRPMRIRFQKASRWFSLRKAERSDRVVMRKDRSGIWLMAVSGAAIASGMALTGCVQIKAPDKPIEINLNVNIRQEVIIRLEKDVRDLIEKHPGVF